MISPSNYRNWLFILCFWPLTRLNCWAYTYCIKKSTSLVTSLTIFLIGWVSRFYVLQRISPWALPLLLQSVVFDFLSNTPGGAVACASTVLNAFRDFNTEDLSNKTPLLNCIYSTMGFEGMYGYFWCLQFNNTCQAHPTFSAFPVPPPELISVVWSPRISTFTLVTRRFPIP